jgi:hypothetical protein
MLTTDELKNFLPLMESGGSLPHSQDPISVPSLEKNASGPNLHSCGQYQHYLLANE